MKKKQSLQRPSERLLTAQNKDALEAPKKPVTFHFMAEILTLSRYNAQTLKDGCRAGMEEIKAGLGYESASAAERLLIDQIALAWLRVGEAEAMYSQTMSQSHNFDQAEYAEKRLTSCTKRYTHLLEALTRVRRLMIPNVQINIADNRL
jgi:hypothetical protein